MSLRLGVIVIYTYQESTVFIRPHKNIKRTMGEDEDREWTKNCDAY